MSNTELFIMQNLIQMKTKLLLIISISICTIVNAQYTKILDFEGTNGEYPYGSLISDGTFLYGMTEQGGTSTNCGINGCGVIFKIKPDGTGYSDLLDFIGTNGNAPHGSLISDGTFLYGMTSSSVYGEGTVFKIKPDGTGYFKLHEFVGGTDGSVPDGSLISDGTFLYGMTNSGGTNNGGTIFKIKPDGTGYAKLFDSGSSPRGSLYYDGTFLYGMTEMGGVNQDGTVFKIKPDGTGYLKLHDFAAGTDGSSPHGDLISDGTFLYGMTYGGGTNGYGIIFKIMPNGTGYVKLLDFASTNGILPYGSLISDGTFLYGMTSNNVTGGSGNVFKVKPDGTGYSELLDFATANCGTNLCGLRPQGSLFSDGIFLYGMTSKSNLGTGKYGTVFKLGIATGIDEYSKEIDFSIYPNPFSSSTTLQTSKFLKDATLIIYNTFGQEVKQIKNITGQTITFHRDNLPSGLYFIRLTEENKTFAADKLVITDN